MGLLVCPDCGTQVSDQAPACPSCGRPVVLPTSVPPSTVPAGDSSKASSSSGIGCLVIIVLVLAIWGYSALKGDDPPGEDVMRQTAINACTGSVEKQLKAPSSAEFGGEVATPTGDGGYTVTGYVDAENSFGASLRQRWTCVAVEDGGTGDDAGYVARATLLGE